MVEEKMSRMKKLKFHEFIQTFVKLERRTRRRAGEALKTHLFKTNEVTLRL